MLVRMYICMYDMRCHVAKHYWLLNIYKHLVNIYISFHDMFYLWFHDMFIWLMILIIWNKATIGLIWLGCMCWCVCVDVMCFSLSVTMSQREHYRSMWVDQSAARNVWMNRETSEDLCNSLESMLFIGFWERVDCQRKVERSCQDLSWNGKRRTMGQNKHVHPVTQWWRRHSTPGTHWSKRIRKCNVY